MTRRRRELRQERERTRRQQEQRRIYIAAAGVAAVVLIGIGFFLFGGSQAAVPTVTAHCGDIQNVANEGRGHLVPGQTPTYQSVPPTSGIHNDNPMPPGVYSQQIDVTRGVHSLEHGYIIIYHNDLPSDQVQHLANLQRADNFKLIVSPYSGLPSKVALTAWTHLQTCDGVDTQALKNFIAEFRNQGPEASPF